MNLRQALADELDIARTPGRRPVRAGQILQQKDRTRAVVVPAKELREKRSLEDGIDPVLVAEEPGCRLVNGDLANARVPSASATSQCSINV